LATDTRALVARAPHYKHSTHRQTVVRRVFSK